MNIVRKIFALSGTVKVELEGFFIQRFINLCTNKNILLEDIKYINNSKVVFYISKNDFKSICKLVKQTKCKIKIIKKRGIPFLIHRYRKRKLFLVLLLGFICFSFFITRFVWNIDIVLDGQITNDSSVISLLRDNGVKERITKIKN